MTIHAATWWPTNADMIADVVELGYIQPTDSVIDLTFGRGKWWTVYRHPGMFMANLDPATSEADLDKIMADWPDGKRFAWCARDFRRTGLPSDHFDVITFDPPYISMGGRKTSKLPDFMDRYGLEPAPSSPAALHEHNRDGLEEAYRICKPGGFVMTKVAPYISSGRFQPADRWMENDAETMGFTVHDRFIHVGHTRPQPQGRTRKCPACDGDGEVRSDGHISMCATCNTTGRVPTIQQHARQNYSVLLVLRKPGGRKKK